MLSLLHLMLILLHLKLILLHMMDAQPTPPDAQPTPPDAHAPKAHSDEWLTSAELPLSSEHGTHRDLEHDCDEKIAEKTLD
ncbi:hypothetical protein EMCRGX_G003875 [Ephydatia muelleri]